MKTKIARFVRSICLSIVFVITIFSLFQGRNAENPTPNMTHIVAGSLLLIGSLVHTGTNADWVRNVFSRPASQLPKRVRTLRTTDLWLFVAGTACAATAVTWLLNTLGKDIRFMRELHALSGLAMSLILLIHLLQHRGWLVNTFRILRKEGVNTDAPANKEIPVGS
jgi:hypothetical protein